MDFIIRGKIYGTCFYITLQGVTFKYTYLPIVLDLGSQRKEVWGKKAVRREVPGVIRGG